MMTMAPTPNSRPTAATTILRDGASALLRFHGDGASRAGVPLLLVPSVINRWYVLDLHPGSSLAGALVEAGFDTFCLDWGISGDEDRYLTWEDLVARIGRAVKKVCRVTGHRQVGMLGYCMGGTLAAIHTALEPEGIAGLVNLAGPIDFSKGGTLRELVDPRWFDADAIGDAGNVKPVQMQSGFMALNPTGDLGKWIRRIDRIGDPEAEARSAALEGWASDNIPFPGAAYKTYIGSLYQRNELIAGTHHVAGRRVDLGRIECPVLDVVTSRDTICPPAAALPLLEAVGSDDAEAFEIPGGHVGAVVGRKASTVLYPKLVDWFGDKLDRSAQHAAQ
jgi:poly[(R)-3-hydroxyalkanoate] polymerase subunit PhaC